MNILSNEKANSKKKKVRRRLPSARPHTINPPSLVAPSNEELEEKVYPNRITVWIKAHRFALILLTIIFFGGILRIYDLGAESIYYDEASSILQAQQSFGYVISQAIDTQNSPPLYFSILHFQMLLFGSSEIAVRFPSAIFGIISLFFIYKIGCQLYNKKIGLTSSFLLAISAFHIAYSQDVRSYSLFVLMTLVSYYFFIQILKTNNKWSYFGYFIGNILLCYSHVFGFIVILAQIIYMALFWRRYQQQRTKFAVVQLVSAFAFSHLVILILPRFTEIVEGGAGNIGWISEPSLLSIVDTFYSYSGYGQIAIILLPTFFILMLTGIFTIKRINGRTSIRIEPVGEVTLLFLWLSFPIIVPFILSFVVSPIYALRYIISALPAFLLLTAKGIGSFANSKATYGIIAFITIVSLIGLTQFYIDPMKEQWRETAGYIEDNSLEDEIIFVVGQQQEHGNENLYCFDYYYRGESKIMSAPWEIDWMDSEIIDKERLWLVMRSGPGDPNPFYMEEYLLNRLGSDSVLLENTYFGIKVLLFDLHSE